MTNYNFSQFIDDIPNFPEAGIVFRDISPLLANQEAFREAIEAMAAKIPASPQYIVGIESRGFIFGSALAFQLGCGFVPLRKPGKLPGKLLSQSYSLEYGEACLEIQENRIIQGESVVILDDVLATGGTGLAAIELMQRCQADILCFMSFIALEYLEGVNKIQETSVTLEWVVGY